MKGIDYSWARPGGKAIKDAGFGFVMRYVPFTTDDGHGLGKDELADLRANGLAVGLVFESSANRPLDGFAAGQSDAGRSQIALRELGMPLDLPIYFGVDFDAQPNQFAVIDQYLKGCAGVLGPKRVGVYGSYAVVSHCAETKTATWFWQTYAWSGRNRSAGAHLYQYSNGETLNGGEVDYDEAYGDEQGLWKPEEDGMNADEKKQLKEASEGVYQLQTQVFGKEGLTPGYVDTESGELVTIESLHKRLMTLEGQPRVQAQSAGGRVHIEGDVVIT